jgi:hypothetical protein
MAQVTSRAASLLSGQPVLQESKSGPSGVGIAIGIVLILCGIALIWKQKQGDTGDDNEDAKGKEKALFGEALNNGVRGIILILIGIAVVGWSATR